MKAPKVLVIDDSVEATKVLTKLLRAENIEALSAADGQTGLAMARGQPVDLVLLDLGLPDLSGLEVLQQFKADADLKLIPIIIITGQGSTEDEIRAFEQGAIDYIRKPFNLAEAQARILAALRGIRSREKAAAADEEERQRTQAELLRISKAVDCASDAICISDGSGKAIYCNRAFGELFGLTLEQLQEPNGHKGLFTQPETWDAIWNVCRAGASWSDEVEMRIRHGQVAAILCRADAILDRQNLLLGSVFFYTDITERKRFEQDLVYSASHDPLTGLKNRRHFGELLKKAVDQAKTGRTSFLFYLDLDNFKVVNDWAGHQAGDRLLKESAALLQNNTRATDQLARFGGDEFTVLVRHTDESSAIEVAQRLLRAFDGYRFVEQDRVFSTSVSIGIAPVDGSATAEDIVAQADSVCYLVKSKGRNGYELFRPDNQEIFRLRRDASWSLRIKEALREERLELWLQPILPLRGQQKVHFEVLLRMRDTDGKLILPGEFLPAAEQFGNMLQVDYYVVRHAIDLLKQHPDLRLAINLSAKTLNDPGLPDIIERQFAETGSDPARVSFEVTETALIQNLAQARQLILRVKKLGCQFALDDFGSGASSMMYLRDLPVDFLKIEGSFIQGIDTDPINRALVKSMNDVAHILGKQTVAEYVVSAGVLRVAQELEIDYGQGWYLCEPGPPAKFLSQDLKNFSLPQAGITPP